ncbi:hypothetical protein C8J56DRAFT_879902 [Mycena floridula]|nr:hypothetical protein C8J56DRAFT_879902 [Mycena floridula]
MMKRLKKEMTDDEIESESATMCGNICDGVKSHLDVEYFQDSSFTSNVTIINVLQLWKEYSWKRAWQSMDGLVRFGETSVERIMVLSGESSVIEENDIEPFDVDGKRYSSISRSWISLTWRMMFTVSACKYIIFQPWIQASLQRTISSWNLHQMRTEHYKTPMLIYELSREKAIVQGYWSGDPGDDIATASHVEYGRESEN